MSELPTTLLPSRDGARICQVNAFIEKSRVQNRDAVRFTYEVQFGPKSDRHWINVLFSGTSLRTMDPTWYGRPQDDDPDPHLLALCRIGDWLDRLNSQPDEPPDGGLEAFSYYLTELKERAPAEDSEIRRYMGAKSWWAHNFNHTFVHFREVDQLLLNADEMDFVRVVRMHPEYWEPKSVSDAIFEFDSELLKDWERGRFPGRVVSPIYHVGSILQEGRYAGPRTHFEKAVEHFAGDAQDTANSVKEAASALESMLKVITGQPNAKVSAMTSQLQSKGLIHPALLGVFEKIWGYASTNPGARHAGTAPPTADEEEAQFVLTTVAASLVMLREVDPGR